MPFAAPAVAAKQSAVRQRLGDVGSNRRPLKRLVVKADLSTDEVLESAPKAAALLRPPPRRGGETLGRPREGSDLVAFPALNAAPAASAH